MKIDVAEFTTLDGLVTFERMGETLIITHKFDDGTQHEVVLPFSKSCWAIDHLIDWSGTSGGNDAE